MGAGLFHGGISAVGEDDVLATVVRTAGTKVSTGEEPEAVACRSAVGKRGEGEMSDVVKRNPMSSLTELFDWFNSGWPAIADWPHDGARALRIEDRLEPDRYVVRAEIPGVDPDKDVEITVDDGVLTISAERREEVKEKGRSEFHYGSFLRRVSLPPGSKEDQLEARYEDGILEVTVPIGTTKTKPHTIPVTRGSAT
jgi:HSP20 family molecular chaperone IbpA